MVTASTVSGIDPRDIISVFAQNGFCKTSMEDIAQAVGLSRQSIYKKFGSKEACYNWSLKTYMTNVYTRVFAILEEMDGPPQDILERVFDAVVGDGVDLAKTPHGVKLVEDSLEVAASQKENWPECYRIRLSEFLLRSGFASSPEQGQDIAHLLVTASRGALVVASSRQDFSEDMRRIIKTVLSGA
ncbi:TetR/AcrR family transcriptional regulator [Ruegeria halocynthiae]|uniref:TetR/AcrR family transcriptional regulator n=1 Tax=Ruegeria halocynthiae TaxID=985054 RepID=UPI00068EB9F7|nr:TetR/AcrR family transcriptional regulator [Ruegeria halocynthiae]